MTFLWLLFASLTVVGSLAYNVSMKFGATNANVFGFVLALTAIETIVQLGICAVARYGYKIDVLQGMNGQTIRYAVLCGCAVAMIDICYFFALRYGSAVASQIFWTVGGMIALASFAALFLGEAITPTKALGIAFGIAAVLLITKQS